MAVRRKCRIGLVLDVLLKLLNSDTENDGYVRRTEVDRGKLVNLLELFFGVGHAKYCLRFMVDWVLLPVLLTVHREKAPAVLLPTAIRID